MKRGRRPSSIPKQQVEAEKLYLKGVSKRGIAASVGVSLMTIYRWAEKYNWEESYIRRYEEESSKIADDFERIIAMTGKRRPEVSKKCQENDKSK
jgi:transposase